MAANLDGNLQEIIGCKGSQGYFMKKKLLNINDIKSKLCQHQNLHEAGEAMYEYLGNNPESNFGIVPFPITKVQHVTTEENMSAILDSQCFRAMSRRADFKDLSFWSVHIPKDDVNTALNEACQSIESPHGLKREFANSPAFNHDESRYGNFMFCFSLSELLDLYRDKHCGGKMPLFKYFGTDLFKQEIAHYIVIHSPDSHAFDGFDTVDSEPFSHVYWTSDTFYWKPESTSDKLYNQKRYYVWNNLIFAFHLPGKKTLNIRRKSLLGNLSACKATERPYLGETKTTKEEAMEIISMKKRHYQLIEEMDDSYNVKLPDE